MCCTRLAENTGRKKSPFRHHRTICLAVSSQLKHVSTIGRKVVKMNISSTWAHNALNFGLITAEFRWRLRGTPANFNGFRVLAALVHSTLVVGVSQTAALNRGLHLYLAGWPSRWALAHISSLIFCQHKPDFDKLSHNLCGKNYFCPQKLFLPPRFFPWKKCFFFHQLAKTCQHWFRDAGQNWKLFPNPHVYCTRVGGNT